jgi:hypothetical protein
MVVWYESLQCNALAGAFDQGKVALDPIKLQTIKTVVLI